MRFASLFASLVLPVLFLSTDCFSLDRGGTLIAAQRYTEADSFYTALLRDHPDTIHALSMHWLIAQTRILDYESYPIDGPAFLKQIDSMCVRMEPLSGRGASEANRTFFAALLGMKGAVKAKNGDPFGGLGDSRRSVALFSEILSKNPYNAEARLGTGVYNYYVGTGLKLIPGNADRSASGCADVARAARDTTVVTLGARNALFWILFDKKEYRRADSLAAASLRLWPDNTIFMRARVRSLLKLKQFTEAESLGSRLAERSRNRYPVNWSDMLSGYQAAAEAAAGRGDSLQAYRYCDTALALDVPASARRIIYVRKHCAWMTEFRKNR